MIAPGSTVDQKYWVERVIGRGGMGVVVAATHLQLGQRVALKFLHGDASFDPEAVARFLREARAAVRLRSEHVSRVLDVGTLDDGAPFIVMEFLEGEDLAALLARGGPLAVPVAVDYVLQACLALAEAHGARIVHRDLKPSNLFLTRRPDGTALLKVMDFGIAKAHGTLHAELTASSAVMGSPGYMSPEQLQSARDVDARADLWSLGVVLYELVTGRRPYVADSVTAMAVKIATEDPAPLPLHVPRGYADAVMRCLARDRERRFADVAALARALASSGGPGAVDVAASVARVQAGGGAAAARPAAVRALMNASTVSHGGAAAVNASTTGPGGDTVPYLGRGNAFWIGIAAGTVAVAIVVIIIVAMRRPAVGAGIEREAEEAMFGGPAIVDAGAMTPVVATSTTMDAGAVTLAVTGLDAGPTAVAMPGSGQRPRGGTSPGSRGGSGSGRDSGSATPAGGSATPAGGSATPASGSATTPPTCIPTPADTNCDGIPEERL